jgi:hypothetical protein
VDAVYIVRPAAHSEELRYSLRSLVNLPHDRVILVGHLPAWAAGVKHIPTVPGTSRSRNILRNWQAACLSVEVSDPFIRLADDHFITSPVGQLVTCQRGSLATVARAATSSYGWRQEVRVTDKWLQSHEIGRPLCYDLHRPNVMTKAEFLHALALSSKDPRLLPLSVWGNLYEPDAPEAANAKVTRDDPLPGGPFASTSDAAFATGQAGRQLRAMFPNPSPYEVSGQ